MVRALAHRIVVLRGGRIVETGETEALFAHPHSAYTRALMAAAFDHTPDIRPDAATAGGAAPT